MERLWGVVVKSFEQDEVMWIGCLIILLLAMAASHNSKPGWLAYRPKGYNRGKRMLRRARQEHVHNLIAQEFVDTVEMHVYNGAITRQEATECYRRLKQLFPISSLFPNPELLKENIKKRLGKHVEPKLPGSAPKIRPKNLFDNSPKRVAL
jgi:hypothetical protein